MANVGNWVGELTSTIGQGDVQLGGALDGFATFVDAIPDGEVWYVIIDKHGNTDSKEAGKGTLTGGSTLARTTIHSTLIDGVFNDQSPSAIVLSGFANVFCTFNKTAFDEIQSSLTDLEQMITDVEGNALWLSGGNNQMGQGIDMDGNRITNLPAPVAGHEAARYQDVLNVSIGDEIVSRVVETQTLADGQVEVTLQDLTMVGTTVSIIGDSVDSGDLDPIVDYDFLDNVVTLTSSYPAGTKIKFEQDRSSADALNSAVFNFATTDDAATSQLLADGNAINIKDNGLWDAALASTVTPNGANIIQCTGVAELAIVKRKTGHHGTMTLAQAKALIAVAGDTVVISDRGNGLFEYKTGITPDGIDSFECVNVPTLSLLRRPIDYVTAEDYGIYGDGVTDYSDKIQELMNTGRVVVLKSNTVYIAKGLTSVEQSGLVCLSGRAIIQLPAGSELSVITVTTTNFVIDGINFDGGEGDVEWFADTTPFGARDGIVIGADFGTSTGINEVTIQNVDIYGFNRFGLYGKEVQVGFEFGKRVSYQNVNIYRCYAGWAIVDRHEYCSFEQCYGYECRDGMQLSGGNNTFTNCHFTWNYRNCVLETGENDGHGMFVGCNFNHSATTTFGSQGLACNAIKTGMVFTGCMFYYAPIEIKSSRGIQITNSHIATGSPITIDGGGVNHIDDNYTHGGPLSITQVGFTFTTFRRNFEYDAASTAQNSSYGDVFVHADASLFSYPIAWSATTDTILTLGNLTRKYHQVDQSFLHDGTTGTITGSNNYQFNVNVKFDMTTSSDHVILKLRTFRGGSPLKEYSVSGYFVNGLTECSLNLSQLVFLTSGDSYNITLKTAGGETATIQTGGIDFTCKSLDN